MRIGPFTLSNGLVLAPMAGVTDRPFRMLCRALGAGLAISEMVSSDPALRRTRKSLSRIDHDGEPSPIAVQIAGADPARMADAARYNVDRGAELIDINMGCPAKKVCNVMAGSALMRDEGLVARILKAVVAAVEVPVTLKMRTGWDPASRNAVTLARIAESEGIQAVTVHGRTRACGFRGTAEYHTVRAVKRSVGIPVIANGDIDSGARARDVLARTGADGLMIGRAAQGDPWIFRRILGALETGVEPPAPSPREVRDTLIEHLRRLHDFHGEDAGVRIARKHISWYCRGRPGSAVFWQRVREVASARDQIAMTRDWFDDCLLREARAA